MGNTTSGNHTDRRGSRYIQRPILDRETARTIKVLILAQGQDYTSESVALWIGAQAEQAWQEYDAQIDMASGDHR